jgi:hypothetical protein
MTGTQVAVVTRQSCCAQAGKGAKKKGDKLAEMASKERARQEAQMAKSAAKRAREESRGKKKGSAVAAEGGDAAVDTKHPAKKWESTVLFSYLSLLTSARTRKVVSSLSAMLQLSTNLQVSKGVGAPVIVSIVLTSARFSKVVLSVSAVLQMSDVVRPSRMAVAPAGGMSAVRVVGVVPLPVVTTMAVLRELLKSHLHHRAACPADLAVLSAAFMSC